MKDAVKTRIYRALRDQRGQALPWVATMMVMLLGFAGLSIDVGHVFYCYRELQAATDAAALAGAEDLPNSTATSTANSYSALSGKLNANTNLGAVLMVSGYPKAACLTALKNVGMGCVAPANGNVMQVKQTAAIPTFFLGLFGIGTFNVTASATASMRGSAAVPYNVAIVLDSTNSMSNNDSRCGNISRVQCAMEGVQTLLAELYPCTQTYATCPTDGSNSVDRVSLFTYPNITVGTAKSEYCGGGSLSIVPYSFPVAGASTYPPSGSTTTSATYQVVPWLNDYRTSDTTSGTSPLAVGSDLVSAVDGDTSFGGTSSCSGLQTPGGEGTFFAGAIYAAQAALVAEQAAYPNSQNALIILSDGAANSQYYTSPKQNGNPDSSPPRGKANQMASTDVNGAAITGTGTYPSYNNQCAQAVTAAGAANTAGTKVFTVAYGASTNTSDCSTDNPAITPCTTMQTMASNSGNFYSDTCPNAMPAVAIQQIFADIGASLTVARLIPDIDCSVTPSPCS
jgi:Flp pilus assembly protein TadG